MPHHLPTLVEMLEGLISTPSISSVSPEFDQSNRPVIELLGSWLSDLGFSVEILPLASQPHKANLIATRGSGPSGLVLAGHTDTVPYDEGRWQHDPFSLTEDGGRFYGLGTSDMKGFFALVLQAALKFRDTPLAQPLVVLATADEESSMDGAKALVSMGRPQARYAVIGEPTGMVPVNAHKGILMEAIHVIGRSGHSSDPALGRSALEGMHRVVAEILSWRSELQGRHRDPAFKVPMPTLNLGHIHGGDNPNRICAECELHIDLRPLPGMSLEELRRDLRERVTHALVDSELKVEVRSLIDGTEPMHTPLESDLVRACEGLTGHRAEAAAYCTEGPYLNALGMDTVILGPGDIACAHQPDEYLPTANVRPMVGMLEKLIERFCV
ncbi:MAG: acetylornithine deacetylase [Gammaproteobacteria bacterium SG8_47]|nr:MAG: acetylornithine deacetylase [Gammaproteobacteria bacterium SG8_47]